MPFARPQPPSTIAATCTCSSGSSPSGRYTRAISKSATLLGAELDVAPGRFDEARQEARPQHGELGRDRLGEAQRLGSGRQAAARACRSRSGRGRRARPRRGGAAAAAGSARRTSRGGGSVNGTSSSRLRATSSTTSTSRVTSRARHVGVTTSPSRISKPSRSSQRPAPRRRREADQLVGALGPVVDHRPLGEPVVHVGVGRPARAGSLDEQLRGEVGRRLGQVRVDALLPAVRALRAQPQALGAAEDRGRLEVGRLEQHLVVDSPISVSSPPMIPASATERSASAIIRSSARASARRRRACGSSRRAARGGR